MQHLLDVVLKSESKLLGYCVRLSDIDPKYSAKLPKNETNNRVEVGCTLRIRHSVDNSQVISGILFSFSFFPFYILIKIESK